MTSSVISVVDAARGFDPDEEFSALERATREWWRVHAAGFLHHPDYRDLERELTISPPERMMGVWNGSNCIATTNTYDLALVLPGGATVPVCGVANVVVSPDHRRQGLGRTLLEVVHREASERGAMAAALTASESSIYSRFGYGVATSFSESEIRTDRAGLNIEPDLSRIQLVRQDQAHKVLPGVYRSVMAGRAGTIERDDAWWQLVLHTTEGWKGGGRLFVGVHRDSAGEPDGYALWRYKHRAHQWVQRNTASILEIYGATDQIEAALFAFVRDVDLVDTVELRTHPVDDPLRRRLAEPRQLIGRGPIDMLWLAPLDPVGLLGARGYRGSGRVVVGVSEPAASTETVRVELSVADGSAEAVLTDAPADVDLPASALATLLLGEATLADLMRADLVEPCSKEIQRRVDDLFCIDRRPYCSTFF